MLKFKNINNLLVLGKPLPDKNKNHNLSGNWFGYKECHIEPNWLLIYKINKEKRILEYARMGSHSDLFS